MEFPSLRGGALALDFVNTVDPRIGPTARDFLTTPQALAAWSAYAGIDAAVDVDEEVFRRAIDVREALYRIFVAVASGREPAQGDLAAFKSAYAQTLVRAELVLDGEGYTVRPTQADALLWSVLESAFELLTSRAFARIKECPGNDCGWVFLDASRGGTRRWCSMQSCGARAKMRRYRERSRR